MKTIYTEFDPLFGVYRDVQTDGRNMREVTRTDAAGTRATLDHLQRLRGDESYARQGIKEGWHHAATIPAEVVVEWLNEGFDVFKAHPSEILKRLRNRDYEKLRATSGRI
jgi:hypothetical protein